MEFSQDVDSSTDVAQLKLLKGRVQQLQMQNLKLEHLLKTNSPSKISANNSFLPTDQFDLLNSCWSSAADDKCAGGGCSQLGEQFNHQQQIPISLQGTNIAPACNTTFFSGHHPPQSATHQGQLVQGVASRLGDATAFIQNNQNTLVQNNTNLIQPINLVNIGSLTEEAQDASASTTGGFILMRDGRLSYVPQAVVRQDTTGSGLPGIECMLGQHAVLEPAVVNKRSDRHLNSSQQQARKPARKRPRPLKPKPIAPATSRPFILPKQQGSRSNHQPTRKQSRAKRKSRALKPPPPVQEDVPATVIPYCPVEQLEVPPQRPTQPSTAYFNCIVARVRRPRRLEDCHGMVKIHVEENTAFIGRQKVPSKDRVNKLFALLRPKESLSNRRTASDKPEGVTSHACLPTINGTSRIDRSL